MFGVKIVNGLSCPTVFCDVCSEQLINHMTAAAVFDDFHEEGRHLKTYFVHKGCIDGRTCHETADTLVAKAGGTPGWQELRTYLESLTGGVTLAPRLSPGNWAGLPSRSCQAMADVDEPYYNPPLNSCIQGIR